MNNSTNTNSNDINNLYNEYNSYLIMGNLFLNVIFFGYYGSRKVVKLCKNFKKNNNLDIKETIESLQLKITDMIQNKQQEEINILKNNVNNIKSNYQIEEDEQKIIKPNDNENI